MEDIPKQNTGVLEGSGTKSLYLGGTIPYEVRLQSGDWRPYLVKEEKQYSQNVDTMGCVSFSLNNDLEIQNKFLGREINFSDRFLAKMANTTPQGQYLDIVANTARNIGSVKEDEWPEPANYNWNTYYAPIPQDVINKAVKQPILYEETGHDKANLLYQLKQCPIQITIPEPHPNHAVVLVAIVGDTAYYFDTYPPYLKSISLSKISYALKIVLKGTMTNSLLLMHGSEYGIYDPATSPDGLITLMRNRGMVPPLKPDGTVDFSQLNLMVQGEF